jgi:hypothetical protein
MPIRGRGGQVPGGHGGEMDLFLRPGRAHTTRRGRRVTAARGVPGGRGGQQPDRDRQRGAGAVAVAAGRLLPGAAGLPGGQGFAVIEIAGYRGGQQRAGW